MKKAIKYSAALILFLVVGFVCFLIYETQDQINATNENIEAILEKFHNEERLAGFAVSVFSKDSIIYMNGFGYSNKHENVPYTINTQQYIASISKTTIGIAVMKAKELDLLNLDDPINKYLPFEVVNPNHTNVDITIRHLATHTSSLDYNEQVVESLYVKEIDKDKSLASFMKNYFDQKLHGDVMFTSDQPGTNYNYSNIGSGLVAYIIEVVSGMTYSDFTQKYIFEPLNLHNTFWFQSVADSLQYSKYYEVANDSIKEVHTEGVKLYPCRDLITDIKDLTTYCQSIIAKDPKVLTKSSYDELLKPQLSNSVTNQGEDNSGLFIQIDRNQYGIMYQLKGHTGADNCINSIMLFDPVTELGYIFVGNTGQTPKSKVNHILIYRALVSLGDHYILENPKRTKIGNATFKFYNYYSRVSAFF